MLWYGKNYQVKTYWTFIPESNSKCRIPINKAQEIVSWNAGPEMQKKSRPFHNSYEMSTSYTPCNLCIKSPTASE